MCFMQVFEAFYANSEYLNLMCYTDPLSLSANPQPSFPQTAAQAAAKGRLFPWTPARSLAGDCAQG